MSKDLLSKIFNSAKKKGKIDELLLQEMEAIFPNKSEKVFEVIRRGITQYCFKPSNRKVWIAMGVHNIYLIYPKMYCSCRDFYNSVVVKREKLFCKHILAQTICQALKNYQEVELEDIEFNKLITDLHYKI